MTDRSDLFDPAPTTLGYCPHCAVPIPTELLLIEYERGHEHTCYAECPACGEVVRPGGHAHNVGEV